MNRIRIVAALSVLALGGAACQTVKTKASEDAAGETVNSPAPTSQAMDPGDMDAAHEAGVKAFPAKTAGVGGTVLAPRIVAGVRHFEVTAKAARWETSPGVFADAYAYNGIVPGPTIRARKGDRVAITLRNELPESTVIHWHGLTVPNEMDGVPFITQPPVKPGERFTYSFTVVDEPGTFMYHSHHNATEQVGRGLLGLFVIESPRPSWNQEAAVVLGDGAMGFTINGKSFPATVPIVAKKDAKVLLRFANAGQQLHPMHLHGFHFTVTSRDGFPVQPYTADTLVVAPGERYDAVFTANLPGVWAFHCHILSHAESREGMFGMVTAVIVK